MNDKVSIVDVRNKLSDEQKHEIVSLWKKEGAELSEADAQNRLKEIFAIAIDDNEKIVAVSSTFQTVDPILKVKLHYIRAFVGEDARHFRIAQSLLAFISNTLNEEYNPDDKEKAIGSAWIVENKDVNKTYTLAVSRKSKSVFYGTDDKGNPARVRYFSGAKIPA